jgi:uncharacterized membrane protein
MNMTQNRWRSKVVWTTVIALIILLGGNYGLWDAIGMTSDTFQTAANLVLTILVAVGIINNPTDSENF